MKEKISFLILNSKIRRLYLLGFLFIVLMAVIIAVNLNNLPSKVPLFYSLTWGEQQLVNSYWLFLFPGVAFIFMTVNFVVSTTVINIDNKDYFVPYVFAVFSILIYLLCFWEMIKIMSLFL